MIQRDVSEFKLLKENQSEKLDKAISNAQFYLAGSLMLDGQVKDAINFPQEKSILVSERFCGTEIVEVSGRAMGLLFHEYLGLAKIDDTKYQISGLFLQKYAEKSNGSLQILKFAREQMELDLKGKKSCFKGAVKKKSDALFELYGDLRYWGSQIDGSISSGNSYFGGFEVDCSEVLYDKNGKKAKTPEQARYQYCYNQDVAQYVVPVIFKTSTTGSTEEQSLVFEVRKTVDIKRLISVDASPEDEDYEVKVDKKVTYDCTLLKP